MTRIWDRATLDHGFQLLRDDRASEALEVLQPLAAADLLLPISLRQQGSADLWFAIGMCHRRLQNYESAVQALSCADGLRPGDTSIQLGLGIAQQLAGDLDGSAITLVTLIHQEPMLIEAHNSLGITRSKLGRLEESLDTYYTAFLVLGRLLAARVQNTRDESVKPVRCTTHNIWMTVASAGALSLAARDDVDFVAFPTPETAAGLLEQHHGLAWLDSTADGQTTRLFLPNYFQSIAEALIREPVFGHLLRNRAFALHQLGRLSEAEQHMCESAEIFGATDDSIPQFYPARVTPPEMRVGLAAGAQEAS